MERNEVANLTRIANYVKVQPGKFEINKEKVQSNRIHTIEHNLKVDFFGKFVCFRWFVVWRRIKITAATPQLFRRWAERVNRMHSLPVIM